VKRLIPLFVLFLAVASAPLFALDTRAARSPQNLIDDVIRMSQAGVSDEAIISFVVHAREPFDVTADDVIAMTKANVSTAVVKAVVDEAAARKDDDRPRTEVAPAEAEPYFYPFYPYIYYDPYWYMPHYYNAGGIPHPVTNGQTAKPQARGNGTNRSPVSVMHGSSSKGGRK
jgi:hypothetical protein